MDATEADNFLEQGLFLAQSLLVLDLERCTRCDECTKACSDRHEGVTRLIREGLRFDKCLVASSCRSCLDPLCPVDAIHRNGDFLDIDIDDALVELAGVDDNMLDAASVPRIADVNSAICGLNHGRVAELTLPLAF